MVFKYATWLKFVILSVFLLFTGWALSALIYPLVKPQPSFLVGIAISTSSLLPFYFSYKVATLLPWLDLSIVALDDGFIVKKRGRHRKFLWDDVGAIKIPEGVKICRVFTKTNELICIFYFEVGVFPEFLEMLKADLWGNENVDANLYVSDLRNISGLVKKFQIAKRFYFISGFGFIIDWYFSKIMFSYLAIIVIAVYGLISLKIAGAKCPRCKKRYFGSLFLDEAAGRGLRDVENSECENCGLSMHLINQDGKG